MAQSPSDRLAADVASLQTDMAKVGTLVERLDVTIDKLAEVSTSLSQIIAVQESKLSAMEILTKNISELVEKRRVEMDDKIQQLHGRISSGEKELQEKIDDQYDEIMKELKEMRLESTKQHETLSTRITLMEKWMWIAVGAAVVIGVLIDKIQFGAIF
jgi:predicted  nucleic acid-binding Zn-ribbon protein